MDEEVELVKCLVRMPYLQRLRKPQTETKSCDFMEIFKQVQINIPLLDATKQVSSYATFLKDLCSYKRRQTMKKSAYPASQVSTIVQHDLPPKFKDLDTPTILCYIADRKIDITLLIIRLSVNLLLYTVY